MIKNWFQKLSNWYFSKNALPYWYILLLDCLCIVCMAFLVYLFDNGRESLIVNFWSLCLVIVVYLIPTVIAFRILHTYSGIIRYSSFIDLQRLSFSMSVSFLVITIFYFLVPWPLQHELFKWNRLLIICLLSTGMMWMIRISVKYLYDMGNHDVKTTRVFIYGVAHAGSSVAKSLNNFPHSRFVIKGFISKNEKMQNYWMMGAKVYYGNERIVETMVKEDVSGLVVSPLYNEKFRRDTELIDKLLAANIRIYMVATVEEWDGKSELPYESLHEVNVEDLLPRAQIQVDMDRIQGQLAGKRILITGAAGSIGSEIVCQVAEFNPAEMVLVDQAETPMHDIRMMMANKFPNLKALTVVSSITNQTHMERLFSEHRPEYVFHAAAYKHVPMMEDNPAQAVQNNICGTRVIADLAVKYGTKKFVMISTDKAVNPTNVMGCSKRICEIYVQSLDKAIKEGKVQGVTQFVTTRFGNVLGSNGSVIPIFREQIKNGGPVKVTHPDIIRFFMLIPEACRLVIEAGTMGHGGEIFVFDMGSPVKINDLAQRMIKLSGATNVKIEYTGLRDGEKLYEEVLNDAEQTKPTDNPKIMVASAREYDYDVALAQEKRLYEASFSYDDMAIVKIMKEIVPEYKSRHSKYEKLDTE